MTVRLRRSELATPASNPEMIEHATASNADLVFLDLEDSVVPALKAEARDNAARALTGLDWGRKTRAVRVNGASTPWAYEDVITTVERAGRCLDVLIIPKVKAPRDVWFFDTLLGQLEAKLGLEKRIGLEALIEETEALTCVEEIAACSPRLEALILGVGDLAASQGVRIRRLLDPQDRYPGDLWHYARNRMVVAARAHGLDAIDGPYFNFADRDGFHHEAAWSATLGCVGKWAIHPSQIDPANEVFAPTDQEIEFARQMCAAYESGAQGGAGATGARGVMVDAASVRIFNAVLERARLTGRA
jgi:citrate lyase subunit beta / citryl-CoA lyase